MRGEHAVRIRAFRVVAARHPKAIILEDSHAVRRCLLIHESITHEVTSSGAQ